MPAMDEQEAALRKRIAQLSAEGGKAEREAAAWQLAELIMRGPVGFNPGRRPTKRLVRRLRYPLIETD